MTLRTIICAFLFLNSLLVFGQERNDRKISAELIELIESGSTDYLPVIITFNDQLDVMDLQKTQQRRAMSREQKVNELILSLQSKAAEYQPALLNRINGSGMAEPGSVRALWVVNMLGARLKKELIEQLSLEQDIEWIDINRPIELVGAEESPLLACSAPNTTEPGLLAINAPKLWAMGYTGYGTKAFIVDTGTDAEHPALRNNYLGLYAPDDQAWTGFEPLSRDCQSHGTHVGGTVCGLDRLTNDTIGVAFNALWMASASICHDDEERLTTLSAFEAFQWSLNPDGDPNTTDDMPDVINNSWGVRDPGNGACNSGWVSLFNSMEAAGIAVVFAAGNEGPDPMTLRSPSVVNFDIVKSFTVAAVSPHSNDFLIADFSSRGPSICSGTGSLLIKPEVAAPGLAIRSAVPGGEYAVNSGTSMASPHVAGAILLLKEAFPYLSGRDFQLALYNSCRDLGEPGEDNTFGMGMIDVFAAFNYLLDQGNTPVDPQVDLDALMLEMNADPISCYQDGLVFDLSFENAGLQEITSIDFEYQFTGSSDFSGNVEWTGSSLSGIRKSISLNIDGLAAGEFTMEVKIVRVNGMPDDRLLNNVLRKNIVLVNEAPLPEPLISSINGSAICDSSEAFLQSTYTGAGTVQWYDAATEGALLAEGPEFTLSLEKDTQTIFMDVLLAAQTGMADREAGQTRFEAETEVGLIFDAISPFILKSVKVYSESSGIRLITVVDFEDNIYAQKLINLPAGEFTIPLNFRIPALNDLVLQLESGGAMAITTSNTAFPYEIPGLLQINRSKAPGGGSNRYYFFYDWELEYNYLCGRVPVTINTLSSAEPPIAGFSQSATEIDLQLSGTVSFIDTSKGAVDWLWEFGTGDSSSEQNPSYTYSAEGVYTVSLTVLNAEGCSDTYTSQVTVINQTTATNDPESRYQLEVFPNPARNWVSIYYAIPSQGEVSISLTDLLGHQLKQIDTNGKSSDRFQLDTSPYKQGVYFIIFRAGPHQIVRKLMLVP